MLTYFVCGDESSCSKEVQWHAFEGNCNTSNASKNSHIYLQRGLAPTRLLWHGIGTTFDHNVFAHEQEKKGKPENEENRARIPARA